MYYMDYSQLVVRLFVFSRDLAVASFDQAKNIENDRHSLSIEFSKKIIFKYFWPSSNMALYHATNPIPKPLFELIFCISFACFGTCM